MDNIDASSFEFKLILIVGFVIIFICYSLFKNWNNGRRLFTVKKFLNSLGHWVNYILAVYVFICGAQLVVIAKTWSLEMSKNTTGFAYYMWNALPFAVILLIIYFAFQIINKQWVKYNDKERVWLMEEEKNNNLGLRKRLSKNKYLRYIFKNEETEKDVINK